MTVKGLTNKHVLGIDASTHTLAFCMMHGGVPQKWGEMHYSDSKNLFERLGSIDLRANIIADQFAYADKVVIEAPVKMRNIRVAIALAYSYGIVAAKFAAGGIEVIDVPPVVWQKYIGNPPFTAAEKKALRAQYQGHIASWYTNKARTTRKQRTMTWVDDKFGIKVESDNVSDAIGIAFWGSK